MRPVLRMPRKYGVSKVTVAAVSRYGKNVSILQKLPNKNQRYAEARAQKNDSRLL